MFHSNRVPRLMVCSFRTRFRIVETAIVLVFVIPLFLLEGASASESDSLATNQARSASDFKWRQNSLSSLTPPGKNSVTLGACPPGVIAAEPAYYIYISGTGTAEAVRVTGGTCKGDGRAGTLEFTTVNSHPSGYSVGSASSGIQEASIAARYTPSAPKGIAQSGRVAIPPGEYEIFAPISIRASNQTLDFAGAILNCYTPNDPCIFVGDAADANSFLNITLIGPRGRPMMVAGTKPFIEDNAQQTRIFNVSMNWPPKGASFGSYVQVDNDQAFLLDGLDTDLGGGGVTCNPTYCGAVVSAPGPFKKWAAVGWLKHLNLSLECAGKGVEWISGNSLKISDSVIQGWSVFGVRVSNQRGGYAGLITDNVYFEASPGCRPHSPYGNVGSAAVIAEGVQVKITGLNANGPSGVFPNWGSETGSHDWLYWVVPVHEKFGEGVPLPAGHALTNEAGNVSGTFPKIAGASSYKILKIDWDKGSYPRPYPEGAGKYLLTTIQQSSCATLTCSFNDNGGALSVYSNAGENLASSIYMPRLDFWPGGVVLSPQQDVSSEQYRVPAVPLQADVAAVGDVVTTQPAWAVAAEVNTLMLSSSTPPAAANIEAMHTSGFTAFPGATILPSANLPQLASSGYKGRLNFGQHGLIRGFTPLITLGDSNWGKTWATPGHRPPADPDDLDLGYEGNIDTLYSRAQSDIREYVGKLPDGNPQEDLSASTKTFNVPVTVHGDLTVTGKCNGCAGGTSSSAGQWSVSLTDQKAQIAPANICASTPCESGEYRISYYLDSTKVCKSAGKAATALIVGWEDETGARRLRVPLAGNGVSADNALSLGTTSSYGGGSLAIWTRSKSAIHYSTEYTACASGIGTYALRIAVEKVQ